MVKIGYFWGFCNVGILEILTFRTLGGVVGIWHLWFMNAQWSKLAIFRDFFMSNCPYFGKFGHFWQFFIFMHHPGNY